MNGTSNRAGDYDPIPARIYRHGNTEVKGEPYATWTLDRTRHVKVMAGVTREFIAQDQQRQTSTNVFRIRRISDDEIDLNFRYIMKWRNRCYQFTGVNYPNLAELEVYTSLTSEDPELPEL